MNIKLFIIAFMTLSLSCNRINSQQSTSASLKGDKSEFDWLAHVETVYELSQLEGVYLTDVTKGKDALKLEDIEFVQGHVLIDIQREKKTGKIQEIDIVQYATAPKDGKQVILHFDSLFSALLEQDEDVSIMKVAVTQNIVIPDDSEAEYQGFYLDGTSKSKYANQTFADLTINQYVPNIPAGASWGSIVMRDPLSFPEANGRNLGGKIGKVSGSLATIVYVTYY